MNIIQLKLMVVCVMALPATGYAERVEEQREWTERFEVSTNEPVVEIHNIWGDVHVMPGAEGEVSIAIREHRSAPSQALFERSQEVYGLEFHADEHAVLARVGEQRQSWRGNDPCRGCRVDVSFEVRVPPGASVFASTVNDGVVEISGIAGAVSADNVNGPVTIRGARACESVESINGEVVLAFAAAPGSDCRIHTINGDIHVQVPEGSGLDFAVDLGNGRVTSELPVEAQAIPAKVEYSESSGTHQYRIEQAAGIRLAGGGAVLQVKSLNGDLRIQKAH
jgi:hypothetical protein